MVVLVVMLAEVPATLSAAPHPHSPVGTLAEVVSRTS
jgi:hypothetical protein